MEGASDEADSDTLLDLGKREGFECVDIDGYGGHMDYGASESDGVMGVLCHLDVVPEGSGWERDPFSGEIADGVMYGPRYARR